MMEFIAENFFLESALKILLSAAFGVALGAERRNHLHAIGIRTMILITSSCALLGILSYYGAEHPAATLGDPTRIAAGVVTGVGFLGGGVIMRQGLNVRGITTAALIWVACALGLSIGYGLYLPSAALFVLVMLSLPIFKKFEKFFFPAPELKTIFLHYKDADADIDKIRSALAENGIIYRGASYSHSLESGEFKISILANIPSSIHFFKLESSLKETGSLTSVSFSSAD